MTTSDTLDIDATVRQTIELAEAGCDIVRITAPNSRSAKALGTIAQKVRNAKIHVPLVADIHFMPNAAMEAAKHVEKVRINPGNYADRKKFQIREYSDSQYEEELVRLHEEFSPLVLRCKELGRSMRIGTNHGSLSDRIMNRFGDSPRGMAESALEFIRIAESHGYKDIILSMKSSNPKVMIEAYRLVVSLMNDENMEYPLHLGVTEAGDGEDARIKSAIGIGSLLLDGLGDTIRVSLTEDPVAEIPVAQDLAERAEKWWSPKATPSIKVQETINPYSFTRRTCSQTRLGQPHLTVGDKHPPLVLVSTHFPTRETASIIKEVARVQTQSKDASVEGLIIRIQTSSEFPALQTIAQSLVGAISLIIVEDERESDDTLPPAIPGCVPIAWNSASGFRDEASLARFLAFCDQARHQPIVSLPAKELTDGTAALLACSPKPPIITLTPTSTTHTVAGYRILSASMTESQLALPLWIRNRGRDRLFPEADSFSAKLLDASVLSGSLLCDGIGDLLSVENLGSLERNRELAYNILQGARARISKTEFVACPSCGRTLFDLQSTTQKIKLATGHIKGITIAVMGCIVNGPGEMADADFGYVGSGPGKIDLYVGKKRVKSAIPETDAVDRLINLIQEEGKWIDP
jgi:(E)-4-hydroxy-3-methylbut-2-enyl-diphosphate synthase